jgi:hypothetical protein
VLLHLMSIQVRASLLVKSVGSSWIKSFSSSMVERSAVNRLAVGSNPTWDERTFY